VVIAKGSERVAEVAARFALDAMPGKQMAIDADVRAGAIDLEQARSRRAALQRESQLYGSMDGAMKFVKGDAIAGILITLINIIGGLLIGVLQRGLGLGEALAIYSILTVGDGLVSQIPALLISTGAGIVVTRVASEDEGAHLGKEIGEQVLAQPRAIAIAAGLLGLLALVPGMPLGPFLLLAVLPGGGAFLRLRARRAGRAAAAAAAHRQEEPAPPEELPPPAAVSLELGAGQERERESQRLLRELIPGLRELLYAELGLLLPAVQLRGGLADLAPGQYRIRLAEVPVASGELPGPDRALVLASPEALAGLGQSELEPVSLPGVGGPLCAVPSAAVPALRQAGLEILDPVAQMVLHLGQVLRSRGHELMGIQEAQQLLDLLERTHPALVHEVVPRAVSLPTLAEVLRRLLEEGLSIRNLREVLQALAERGPLEKDPLLLTEHVRSALRRAISYRYAGEGQVLHALLLDPAIEEAVGGSVQRTDQGSFLAMEPDLCRDVVQAVRRHLEAQPADGPAPAILTGVEIRRHVRRLLESELPEVPVLSYAELVPELQLRPLARVSLG
jgi:type III secretion protein V